VILDSGAEGQCVITSDWAMAYAGQQSGGFTDSQKVPYLDFVSPVAHVNAAVMLEHFTHGYPAVDALGAALAEIG